VTSGWTVRRAWPREDRLDLELVGPRGDLLAAVAEDERVHPVGPDDRRLPALAPWVARPGTTLVVHRPGRRAVLRVEGGGPTSYVKVARPRAVRRAVHAHRTVGSLLAGRPGAPQVPVVEAVGPGDAWFRVSGLRGRALLDLARDPGVPAPALDAVGVAAGRCLAALATTVPAGLERWGAEHEVDGLGGWVDRLQRHDPLGRRTTDSIRHLARSAAGALLALPVRPPVTAHRDLHDKQLLVDAGEAGVIDLDTAAAGDPALDQANLLAHLDLRVWQGVVPADRARRLADALVRTRQRVAPVETERVAAHRAAVRARLAALYCFRPGARTVVPRILGAPEVVAHALRVDRRLRLLH
jgi:aminoglycoside phosphotransferase (APT) family kinase protein